MDVNKKRPMSRIIELAGATMTLTADEGIRSNQREILSLAIEADARSGKKDPSKKRRKYRKRKNVARKSTRRVSKKPAKPE